ncbi:MAG TPA: thiamine pyrophosphate-binding protein [Caulobacteraceae bacterium]|jgi:acetolactate synthase-1/2/3 large subunit|nr:thiamine pyrophosphate-binding protein [Caulobacteraceae bacterium]
MVKRTVATEVVETLRDLGVRHVFGVPSGGWVDYMEALRTTDGIDFILTTHEGAAGMMADVSGRLTGAPGACFGTYGPGATNLATGVGEALLDRSPVIALTDEMPAAMRGRTTQMGIDHQALFQPLTKKTTRLREDAVRAILFDAAKVALASRRGPVHVGLPAGMSALEAANGAAAAFEPAPTPAGADRVRLEAAAARLAESRRPVLAVGLGAVRAGVGHKVVALAEAYDMPVVLTPMAKGMLAEDHRLYAGVLFHALSDVVGETHQQADLVLAVGYDPVEFNYESWAPVGVPIVSLDTEPADIDQGAYDLAVDAVGDIGASLDVLLSRPAGKKSWDLEALASRRASMFARLTPSNIGFGPKAALAVLREVLPPDGIMTCDVGAHTHLIGQQWPTPAPGLQIMTNGWSTMGFGLPAAIAAKLVHPDKAVCAVVGDGGFLMTAGELATAVRYGVKIVVVVLTDNDLALIRIKQEKKGNPIYGTPVRAEGAIGGDNIFGVPVRTAADPRSFRERLVEAFAADGPVIVEALIDSREYDEVVLRKDKP